MNTDYWHILKVPRSRTGSVPPEFMLKTAMDKDRIETYCPFRWEWRYNSRYTKARGDRRDRKTFPLFVGYLFFKGSDRALYWLYERGLLNKMLGHNAPACFPSDEIGGFIRKFGVDYDPMSDPTRAIYGAKEYEAYMRTFEEFKPGDMVEYRRGWYEGIEIKVVSVADTKARIMFKFLGIDHLQDVPVMDLRKSQKAA